MLLFTALGAGCSSSFTGDDSSDTTTGRVDAGPVDAGPRDIGPPLIDTSPPPPPPMTDSPLREALLCSLSEPRAQRAILVHVACVDDGSTVPGLVEAWHAGLLGTFQQGVDGWTAFPMSQGCSYWQCLSAATSCADREACFASSRSAASCEPGERLCDPDRNAIVECSREGDALVERFDCTAVGGRCLEDSCQLESGCALGGFGEELGCDGDDVVARCDESVRIECPRVEAGTACTSFAIGGELPTYYCGPASLGGFTAGAYATPVECFFPGGRIAFTNQATSAEVRIDCVAEGFADCNERGCVF